MPRHRLAGVAFSNHGIAFGTETRALVSIMQICFSLLSKETYLNYHLLCFNENAAVYFFFISPTSSLRSVQRGGA